MKRISKFFGKVLDKKYTPVFCLLVLFLATFIIRMIWVFQHQDRFLKTSNEVLEYLEREQPKNKKILLENVQAILKKNPRVAVFAFENQLEKNQIGFLNTKSIEQMGSNLGPIYSQPQTNELLKRILQYPEEYSSEYLHLEFSPVFNVMNGKKVKVGQMLVGYVVPGYVRLFPNFGTYYQSFYKGWMIFLIFNIFLYPFYLLSRRPKKIELPKGKEKDQLGWLEKELNDDSFEEDTTRDETPSKYGWTELFNQSDLKNWDTHGQWYVKDSSAIGFPWGASIVAQYEKLLGSFDFEVEAQRMTGPDGFIILFQAYDKDFTWVLGGWNNSRSEVIGYDETKTLDTIEKFHWYYIKIECDSEKISGFLDGKKIWEIKKSDVKLETPALGFQKGFGVGVWSTMARFQRIRIISTEP